MQSFILFLINLIFPPSREARLVTELAVQKKYHALFSPQYYRDTLSLTHFKNENVRALIHEAKFHRNQTALTILAEFVRHHLNSLPDDTEIIIVPIPLSRQRLRERGYNQATEILRRAISGLPRITLSEDRLIRTRHTKPQTTLARTERSTNVQKAFSIHHGEFFHGKHVIIFDDVITTGATLAAATAAITPYQPASLTQLAVAH